MVCFVNVQSVDRVIYVIFHLTSSGASAPSGFLHKQLDITTLT